MSSLVSDFIIEPVLRQARRFSSGFAAADPAATPAPIAPYPRRRDPEFEARGDNDVFFETDEHGLSSGGARMEHSTFTAATAAHSLDDSPISLSSGATTQTPIDPEIRRDPRSRSNSTRAETRALLRQSQFLSVPANNRLPGAPIIGVPAVHIMDLSGDETIEVTAEAPRRAVSLDFPGRPSSARSLPDDDGMRILRKRIFSIQNRTIPPSEKARLMHLLLSEGYTKSQLRESQKQPAGKGTGARISAKLGSSPRSPTSPGSHSERHGLSGRLQSLRDIWYSSHHFPGSPVENPLNTPLTKEDLRPTFVPPRPPKPREDPRSQEEFMVEDEDEDDAVVVPRFGCKHYTRNVKMQCASCEKWYTCRFCHDEAETHTLPRRETQNMLCMFCGCAQKVSDTCIKCTRLAAHYYCGVCKLWSDDPDKPVYHCADCGLCRVGQRQDYYHCPKCNACLDKRIADIHTCIERSTDCNCPICGDYMFSSVRQVCFMRCGHSIHRDCYIDHMKTSYRCPICNKSCVNMATQFRSLDIAIAAQPMPSEYQSTVAVISCNDCNAKSHTAYHWLGLKCGICQSYNTIQQQLLNTPAEALVQQMSTRRDPMSVDANAEMDGVETNEAPNLMSLAGTLHSERRLSDLRDSSRPAPLHAIPIPAPAERRFTSGWLRDQLALARADMLRLPAVISLPRLRSLGGQFAAEAASLSAARFGISPTAAELGGGEATVSDEDEEEYDDDEYDFWGLDEIRHLTSAESADGNGSEGVDSDEEEEEDIDDDCDDDDDDDDDDGDLEEEISLFGHV